MCHTSTHDINVIFIPSFLLGDVSDVTIDMTKRFSSIEQLTNMDEMNMHLSDDDLYRYIILNESIMAIPSTRGIPLFKRFKSTLLESEWINEHKEDIEKHKEVLRSVRPKGFCADHPMYFTLPILGTIKASYFIHSTNTLVLVANSQHTPYVKEEDITTYREWLSNVLTCIGQYHPYDEIATTELFHELTNERLDISTALAHPRIEYDDD